MVTITVWRDAKEDPPENNRTVWTNRGAAWYRKRREMWMTMSVGRMDPQPSLWCDPQPPTTDGLTTAHVDAVLELAAAELRRRAELDPGIGASAANTAWCRLRAELPKEDPSAR